MLTPICPYCYLLRVNVQKKKNILFDKILFDSGAQER